MNETRTSKMHHRLRQLWLPFLLVWLLVAVPIYLYLLWNTSSPRATAHLFLTSLETGEFDRAFALGSPKLQKSLGNVKSLEAAVKQGGVYHPFVWTQSSLQGAQASVQSSGSVGDVEHHVVVRLERIDGQWRIDRVDCRTSAGVALRLD